MSKKSPITEVPCNGCTLCCQGDVIRLLPEDDASIYHTVPHSHISNALMLAHKPNGDCIYLDERGCSIHDHAPSLCRGADCRSIAMKIDFETARKFHLTNKLDMRVWNQGRKLLEAMKRH